MRFLVDLYRVIILAALAVGVILASYLVFALLMGDFPWAKELGAAAFIAALVVGVLVVLGIGLIATFISVHDRLVGIAESTDRIAAALEAQQRLSSGSSDQAGHL